MQECRAGNHAKSTVCQASDIAQAKQFRVRRSQCQIKDFGSRGQEPIYGIAMLKRKILRDRSYFVRERRFAKRSRECCNPVCG